MRALSGRESGNAGWRRDMHASMSRIGDVLQAQGHLADALAAHRDGLEIIRALAAKDPGNTVWGRDVPVSLGKIGDVLKASGDLAGACARYREALDMTRALAAKDRDNTQWQIDIVAWLWRLALVGDDPRARWGEARSTLEQLRSQGRLTPAQLAWIDTIEAEQAALAGGADGA
jgi:tetratricopeptide (TPR) repeat protein